MDADNAFLELACRIAADSAQRGGGPFGAVVVRDGEVLATGTNLVTRHHDPTAHAEIEALRTAGSRSESHDLTGSVLYASCHPCPMCLTAAWWARVDRVVYAASTEQAASAGFDDARFWHDITHESSSATRAEHRPIIDAVEPFRIWLANPDRQPY